MAVKAIALDDDNIQHLIIGLNRKNVESILRGDVFPRGIAPVLSEASDIVLLFAETDEELGSRFPPALRPVMICQVSLHPLPDRDERSFWKIACRRSLLENERISANSHRTATHYFYTFHALHRFRRH